MEVLLYQPVTVIFHRSYKRVWCFSRRPHRPLDNVGPEPPRTSAKLEEESSLHVTPMVIALFVALMGSMLVLLYFFYPYLVYVILGLFLVASILSVYLCLEAMLPCWPRIMLGKLFRVNLELKQIVFFAMAASLSISWLIYRKHKFAWILQDILGLFFCINMLKSIRLPSFKKGDSIMVMVATGGKSSEQVPRLLLGSHCQFQQDSILGFGDILVPGLLVSYCYGFDLLVGHHCPVYYLLSVASYGTGMLLTFAGLYLMATPQPALLYLVPCILVPTALLALCRGHWTAFWSGGEDMLPRVRLSSQDCVQETSSRGLSFKTTILFLLATIAGVGVMSLPKALSQSGFLGLAFLMYYGINTGVAGVLLGKAWLILEERWPEYKEEIGNPYSVIGIRAFGPYFRIPISILCQTSLLGPSIVCVLLICQFLEQMWPTSGIAFCLWIPIIGAVVLPLVYLGSPADFWLLGALGFITSMTACILALVVTWCDSRLLPPHSLSPWPSSMDDFFLASSTFAFAFTGGAAFPSFQHDMKHRERFPKAVAIGFTVLLSLYVVVAMSGQHVYGPQVSPSLLLSLSHPPLRSAAQGALILHLVAVLVIALNVPCQELEQLCHIPREQQLYMPKIENIVTAVIEMHEDILSSSLDTTTTNLAKMRIIIHGDPCLLAAFTWRRAVLRTTVMVFVIFACASLPDFSKILNLVGAFASNTVNLVLPSLFYLLLCGQKGDWPDRLVYGLYLGFLGLAFLMYYGINTGVAGVLLGKAWLILEERWPEYKEEIGNPYSVIGIRAFGPYFRIPISILCQTSLLGPSIVCVLLICQFLEQMWPTSGIAFCLWIPITGAVVLPLVYLGSPADFWLLGALGFITSMTACILALVVTWCDARLLPPHSLSPWPSSMDDFFLASSTFAFAFTGGAAFPSFQHDMKHRERFPKAVAIGFTVLLSLYVVVAMSGQHVYGPQVSPSLLLSLSHPPLRSAAQGALILHLVAVLVIALNVPCQELEQLCHIPRAFTWRRAVLRTTVMVFVIFACASLPDFSKILNLVGAFASNTVNLVLPSLFYLLLCGQKGDWPDRTLRWHQKAYLVKLAALGIITSAIGTYVAIKDLIKFSNFSKPCYLNHH
ncbi:hypothetical protein LAZ67_2000510 [Cordylochernes scorpioides]|uniref:Amino acid transporter transmembrane domain-containing protein n=1 Tax=Cordylochernes scorpioides TaxID=51811 RepID=A0ABY6K5B8_9ARAC|nr:hypothetical protein LAZ67_2000510 [Cordylochernes scorpioides]